MVQEKPCDQDGYNMKMFYYCTFRKENNWGPGLFLPLVLFFLLVAMYNLGSTADMYLSPSLEVISDKLSCSESLAGVTLLALGNGAPDVFASISAGGDNESAVNL